HARPRDGVGAWCQHLPAARAQLRDRLLPRRAGRRARRRRARPDAGDGQQPHHAELRRRHRRRRGQPRRQHTRRPPDRRRRRHHDHVLPRGERGGDLPHHADRAGRAAARPPRPGRIVRMIRRYGPVALLAVLLVTLPWWLPLVGGYSALGTKILIYGLATMALNLLLGFTGGLSFGHAAYFGLGAYG